MSDAVKILCICLMMFFAAINVTAGFYIYSHIDGLKKRELQLSIEVKELQKRKLNCEFKTKRCPNG